MPPVRTVRRPGVWAAALLVAVALGLLVFQPLRSPWWSGFDFDSVYVASALRLARGERSNFYDHPGAPLQEALGVSFTVGSAVSGNGRDREVDRRLANLDRTRPLLRTWGSLLYVLSALLVFLTVAWVMGHAFWGLLGGLIFLGAPDVIAWAAVVKPDPLLAALSVVVVGLVVEAHRRRSATLFLAAAAALGYAVSVKVHAVGLVAPLVLGALLHPPASGWWPQVVASARAWLKRHLRVAVALAAVWLALVVLVNVTAAAPEGRALVELVAALAGLALAGTVIWLLARRTRGGPLVGIGLGLVAAGLAGAIVPNLVYASMPAPMLRWIAVTASGGGVNAGARPELSPFDVLEPWNLIVLVALIGLAAALRERDLTGLLWASGAVSMGLLAFLRFGEVHYYAATIALLGPLALRALAACPWQPRVVAALVTAAMLYTPYKVGIDLARGRGAIAERTETVNRWVEPRLGRREVALTELESSDSRYFYLIRLYAPEGTPEPRYRFLPTSAEAARYVLDRGLRVGFVITGGPADVERLLDSLGLPGHARRVEAPGFVYRVGAD